MVMNDKRPYAAKHRKSEGWTEHHRFNYSTDLTVSEKKYCTSCQHSSRRNDPTLERYYNYTVPYYRSVIFADGTFEPKRKRKTATVEI